MQIINPILKGFNPDPCICRKGEDYYIATSTFEWFPGVSIYHSKDLKNWQLVSRPLNTLSLLDMRGNPDSGGIWAPGLSYADGKFWLIYTDVKNVQGPWKDGNNYLVTANEVDGEWSEPIYLNSSGFDPSLFHDKDGKKYLVNMWRDPRFYAHHFGGIVCQEYCTKEEKLIGEPKLIFKGTEYGLTEAPHIYKVGDYYYLLTAEGGTSYGHVATLARSKSIEGPYELHPTNPLLTSRHDSKNPLQKAGHASIIHTHTDEWFLVHLMGRPIVGDGNSYKVEGRNKEIAETEKELLNRGYCPLGRESSIQKLEWEDGWPYIVSKDRQSPSLLVQAPNMPEHPFEPNYKTLDHFDDTELNIHFQTLRIPFTDEIGSLTARPDFLRLYGKESYLSKHTQSLVARRWESLNFEAATSIDFRPKNIQQGAGLINYYNTTNFSALIVTYNPEKGRVLDLLIAENAKYTQPLQGKEIPLQDDIEHVHLKVVVTEEKYSYYYSLDEEEWNYVYDLDTYKLSDDYVAGGGFFTGAFVGMHCQDTTNRNLHADFDYFKYEEKRYE